MFFRSLRFHKTLSIPAVGILISFLITACYVYQPSFVRFFDNKIYDVILKRNHSSNISELVEIIEIDNISLEEFGQWPWPRYRVALLLQKLREAGSKAIGLDILFADPDNNSPLVLQKSLKRDLGVDIGFSGLPPELEDNDVLLADILQQGLFALGFNFDFGKVELGKEELQLKPISFSIMRSSGVTGNNVPLLQAPNAMGPLPVLSRSAPITGFMNSVQDRDGILRSTPLLMEYGGKHYANLGLAALWLGLQKPPMILKINKGGIESLRVGKSVVPLDRNGRFMLHFRGKQRTFRYHSAADVLTGNMNMADLKGKFLLIGMSAAGLENLNNTPLETKFSEVEAHATVIDNILTGDFISTPDWVSGLQLLVAIVAGISVLILTYLVRTMIALPTVLALALICWFGSEWAFNNYYFFVSPFLPLANMAVTFVILTFIGMYRTEHEKSYIRRVFSRYVAPSQVERIAEHSRHLNLEGEEKEVTILFSDVREFTSLSEKLSPTELTTLLNQYLTPVARMIRERQGTLDKFVGDAVMAFWNAPIDVVDHQQQAVEAGLAMLQELPHLNEMFEVRFGLTISVGIGLHAGQVRVGNMGSQDLFDYTIIGDNVNLTSRLEGLTRYYEVDIIVSQSLRNVRVDGYELQELDTVRVKGKENPVILFTYREKDVFSDRERTLWQEGLGLYKQANFSEARIRFKTLTLDSPEIFFYKIYQKRCEDFIAEPPEPWDPIFSHLVK